MDVATARWLVSEEAAGALLRAEAEPDPGSLGAGQRLRADLPPQRAAAVLEQATLRRRARGKVGDELASRLFWTPTGLEQATRPAVSQRRARRMLTLGASELVDFGCGLGLDSLAFATAGLAVRAVELDAVTAILAAANLEPGQAEVLHGAAEDLAPSLLAGGAAAFIDPARRTGAGRSWRVEDFTPPWAFVTGLLDGSRPAAAKLGPGLPHALIPDDVEAEWVSDRGSVVEVALWAGTGTALRRAVVDGHQLESAGAVEREAVGAPGRYIYEPDGAVIRAGLTPLVAEAVGGHRLHEGIAYLTSDRLVETPFATAYRVLESMPYSEKTLRAWVRDRRVGVLEIKKRGVDADPAALRKRLRPQGPNAATLTLTPTATRTLVLVVERV